jgi:hypothetical protein
MSLAAVTTQHRTAREAASFFSTPRPSPPTRFRRTRTVKAADRQRNVDMPADRASSNNAARLVGPVRSSWVEIAEIFNGALGVAVLFRSTRTLVKFHVHVRKLCTDTGEVICCCCK